MPFSNIKSIFTKLTNSFCFSSLMLVFFALGSIKADIVVLKSGDSYQNIKSAKIQKKIFILKSTGKYEVVSEQQIKKFVKIPVKWNLPSNLTPNSCYYLPNKTISHEIQSCEYHDEPTAADCILKNLKITCRSLNDISMHESCRNDCKDTAIREAIGLLPATIKSQKDRCTEKRPGFGWDTKVWACVITNKKLACGTTKGTWINGDCNYQYKDKMKCEASGGSWKSRYCYEKNSGLPVPISICIYSPLCITNNETFNIVQLNAIVGYSTSNTSSQIGIINLAMKDMHGFQVGWMNGSYEDLYGFRISGFASLSEKSGDIGGNVYGIQIAGYANKTEDKSGGIQLAGLYNESFGDLYGLQIAGWYNGVLKNTLGGQIAIISNQTNGEINGFQFSGLFNHSKMNINGIQVAGFVNNSQNLNGIQVALANYLYNTNNQGFKFALQIGAYNYSKGNAGFQVGIVNLSDKKARLQLGLINIAKKNPIPILPFINFNF